MVQPHPGSQTTNSLRTQSSHVCGFSPFSLTAATTSTGLLSDQPSLPMFNTGNTYLMPLAAQQDGRTLMQNGWTDWYTTAGHGHDIHTRPTDTQGLGTAAKSCTCGESKLMQTPWNLTDLEKLYEDFFPKISKNLKACFLCSYQGM